MGDDVLVLGVKGLSPHLRGNRLTQQQLTRRAGVYPRTCGGTQSLNGAIQATQGLSPHLRGNLCVSYENDVFGGSIPAPAGEPTASGTGGRTAGVYPRTCGGTPRQIAVRSLERGLSPHLRGNPMSYVMAPPITGSIPAPAGEPNCRLTRADRIWVYPRTCGGTSAWLIQPMRALGLSPHLRGNPRP